MIRMLSLPEIKASVLELPPEARHELVTWVNRLESDYGRLADALGLKLAGGELESEQRG